MTPEISIREMALNSLPRRALYLVMETEMPGMPDGQRPSPSIAVAALGDEVVGMVAGALSGKEAWHRAGAFEFYRTLDELEAKVAGTWLISGLGVVRDWSGRGIEERLLEYADTLAQKDGAEGLSTIIGKVGAGIDLIRFFQEQGFAVKAQADGAYSLGIGVTWVLLERRAVH
jgi:GNAT superfamily N-acetyltransferase